MQLIGVCVLQVAVGSQEHFHLKHLSAVCDRAARVKQNWCETSFFLWIENSDHIKTSIRSAKLTSL